MKKMDNRSRLENSDSRGALATIELLAQQCEQAWQETEHISFPANYRTAKNIVITGMGASWIGAHIIESVYADQLPVPLTIVHEYELPAFVTKDTLVIASSYSGTTEETVTALEEAILRKAHVITISSGGNLDLLAQEHKLPHYTFTPDHNPAKSPRLGLGYSMTALLSILSSLGFITVTKEEMEMVIRHLKMRSAELMPESINNEAHKLTEALIGSMPILVSGPFLFGNAHLFSNQFNETSKAFATYMQIPELNHHLMEGLGHPEGVKSLKFLFLESNLYDERIQKRFTVTKEVVEKNNLQHVSYKPQGTTKLIQAFDCVLFGSFVTYYLAMQHGEDPAPNPWVDYFKKRLKEIV